MGRKDFMRDKRLKKMSNKSPDVFARKILKRGYYKLHECVFEIVGVQANYCDLVAYNVVTDSSYVATLAFDSSEPYIIPEYAIGCAEIISESEYVKCMLATDDDDGGMFI